MTVNESASGGCSTALLDETRSAWWNFTLSGFRPVDESEPVTHVSYFEADAYANWAGARLATEFEWNVCAGCPIEGNFVEDEKFHPLALAPQEAISILTKCLATFGMDAQRLLALSSYRAAPAHWRIQRQVHVQPVRSTRRFVRYLAQPYSPKLSQFLPTEKTMAVYRDQARTRSTMNR